MPDFGGAVRRPSEPTADALIRVVTGMWGKYDDPRFRDDLEAIRDATRRETERTLWETLRVNWHDWHESMGYYCTHPNQHKTGWQCGRQATDLLTPKVSRP